MNITDLIKKLEELKAEHGDLPVYADPNVDGIEVDTYGFESMVQYVLIRGVRAPRREEEINEQSEINENKA